MQEKKISITETCYNWIKQLSDEQQLVLYKAIFEYWFEWKEKSLSWIEQVILELARKTIDISNIRSWVSKWHKWWNRHTKQKEDTAKPTPKEEIEDELFNEFWGKYPRPNNRDLCKTEFSKLSEENKKKAVEQIKVWQNSEDWKKEWGKYIHWSLKYLQDRLYERTPKQHSWKKMAWDIDPIDCHVVSEPEANCLTISSYKRHMELPNTRF